MARLPICGDLKDALLIVLALSASLPFLSAPAYSQQTANAGTSSITTSPKADHEDGFPVTDPLVISKCGACHQPDAKGNLSRISWMRTTPEGWEEAIKRMVRLNGLSLESDDARKILRYLSDEHGLAPEEGRPVEYMAEHRMIDEKIPSADIRRSCAGCHAFGRALSWRRSPDEWKLLENMHIGLFPVAEGVAFQFPPRRPGVAPPAPGADTRPPVDQALDYLTKTAALRSPEWADWNARARTPKLNGRWLVYGSQVGKGRVLGEMNIQFNPSGEVFSTITKLNFVNDGSALTETGLGIVYTGYAWRGRSNVQQRGSRADSPTAIREVMMLSEDQSEMEGRWFWGAYDEFGVDVKLRRAGDAPTVLGADVSSLKTGTADNEIRIYGDHLQDIAANDIDLGPGVSVRKIVSKLTSVITVTADVSKAAVSGKRDVAVRNSIARGAFAVYDKIDYIKVAPQTALAHLGGDPHAKGYCQFEAVAYNNGPDGKANTADDIELGPVTAHWKMEEFVSWYGDDDIQFVGSLDEKTGLFTPALDGPNPQRRFSRNNYGDVWVVATLNSSGSGEPLKARSYLVVAVPQYLRWDQPEVSQ
jgi:quinohemoprotein amine dehydrogenase